MFVVPSRSQTNETMKDVAKIKDKQEHHYACEVVRISTGDSFKPYIKGNNMIYFCLSKPLVARKTPKKENLKVQGNAPNPQYW